MADINTVAGHMAKLQGAITRHDLTPAQMRWHYIQMVFLNQGRRVAPTARLLGMHRRTLQRMLLKGCPSRAGGDRG
jgi:ActR/RegA family two-component response regulator